MKYIDMHLHMEDYLKEEIDNEILYYANSVDEKSYLKTLETFKSNNNVNVSFGVHPVYAFNNTLNEDELKHYIKQNLFTGEIGLDFCWIEDKKTYEKQKEVFKLQLKIVKELNTIPIIHTKGAEKEVLQYLKDYNINKCIIHWYSGPKKYIKDFLNIGAYFTLGPDILTNSTIYKYIPIDKIFLETDNPTGFPWIIEKNYVSETRSKDVILLYKKLAELLDISTDALKEQIYKNSLHIKNS